ncbi:MAG: hypothetical protein JKY65_03440 [Planctomycetes bacterium]|nr:hypothetical protein [Planctomycetota bacterium]
MHADAEGLEKKLLLADAEVVLEFDDAVYSQGDRVRGHVTILPHDGTPDDVILKVGLREIWTSTEDDPETGELTTRSRGSLRSEVLLDKGEHKSVVRHEAGSVRFLSAKVYRFSLPLRTNCRITGDDGGWQLAIHQQEARAIPDFARVEFRVRPAEEFLALVAAVTRGLRFCEVESERSWDVDSGATVFRFLPPAVLKEQIETLELELRQAEGGAVKGTITLDLEETSIGDYFKSFLGLQKKVRSFQYSKAELSITNPAEKKALTERFARELEALLELD